MSELFLLIIDKEEMKAESHEKRVRKAFASSSITMKKLKSPLLDYLLGSGFYFFIITLNSIKDYYLFMEYVSIIEGERWDLKAFEKPKTFPKRFILGKCEGVAIPFDIQEFKKELLNIIKQLKE